MPILPLFYKDQTLSRCIPAAPNAHPARARAIAQSPRTAFFHQPFEPIFQLFVVTYAHQPHSVNGREESRVINPLMGIAVGWDEPGAVDGKQHIRMHQIDIVNKLVEGTLQKSGINRHYGVSFR